MRNNVLAEGIEIVNFQPVLYLRDIDALVIADLHLGYERIKAEAEGIFVPQVQDKKIIEIINSALKEKKASTIIVNGDIKHEFSEGSYHEYKELLDFLEFLSRKFKKVILIKGNHDNFIIRATRKFSNIELCDEKIIGDYFFAHGHKEFSSKAKNVIIGHEHPAIALVDELGIKEKVKCFLFGRLAGKNVIIMPAISVFAWGTGVNNISKEQFLSPFLKKHGVENMKALGLIEGEECLSFPEIKKLKNP